MPKRITPLSEKNIEDAKSTEKTYRLFDGGGLFLIVTPDGGKRWQYKYRFEGREKILSFGVYPEVSLEDARRSRDDARDLLTRCIDPSAVRKEERERERAKLLEAERTPSVRVSFDGNIEIRKGANLMRLKQDEAQFVANLLIKIAW
jgi:hypothetical protein